ncbi:hypothetical protein BGX34_002933 [Mortierella sp. NVP85]|nr:hypothetical protein BGX34_002933 [Mortierella sp. NVP85]
MQSADPSFLGRSKSAGAGRGPPPPVKPKPSTLVSPQAEPGSGNPVAPGPPPNWPQRSSSLVASRATPLTGSSSIGNLRKTFENDGLNRAATTGSSPGTGAGRGGSVSGQQVNRTSNPRPQEKSPALLAVPPQNSSRPRSRTSPSRRDGEEGSDVENESNGAKENSKNGIDSSQHSFSNLRARFQQAALSNQPPPRLDASTPRPRPVVNPAKPAAPTPGRSRLSVDSNASSTRLRSPHRSTVSESSPRLSPNTMKQLPMIPAEAKPSLTHKAPTPPKTPPRALSPDAERNPFMGSDEDEALALPPAPLPARRTSVNPQPNRNSQVKPRFSTAISVRESVYMGRAPPPAPTRAAPRPDSPQGAPPKLPSRANSTILTPEETPEEKERKHRLNKRRRVIQELLETEISYSKDLQLLKEIFVMGMANSPLFTPADEKIIYMNLDEVIDLSVDFAALLTPACGGGADVGYDDAATFVGEAFIQMMSRIRRVYSEYCKRHEVSGHHLQELESKKDLKAFFESCQQQCQGRTKTWDLASFLIKPVQRVLKYPLLINQIHALTPHTHADFEAIATVQKDMLLVAEEINEIKKRKDIVEKIVGPKKKNDSDQLRQAVGGSNVTVDILFEALLEKFNLQQAIAHKFVKYILAWLVSIKEYFETQEALALTLREVYTMAPIHRYDENRSIAKVTEFHKNLSQFSKTIGRELEVRLKKTVYKSIENFLKLFAGPLQVMKKREKKLLDYDSVRGMKDRGETVDKNMQESAEAYLAINQQLLDELPKFLGLTTKYFDLIVVEFSKIQTFFYDQVKGKILEFFAKHINTSAAIDVPGYLATVDVCEEYIAAMTKDEGPLARLQKVTLVKNLFQSHDQAFHSMRETAQRRKRAASVGSLYPRTRTPSTSSHSPMLSPIMEKSPWHFRAGSGSISSGSRSDLLASPTELRTPPLRLRYFPGEDENPFEIPESIFHDGSVTSDEYEPFGNGDSRRNTMATSIRPLSSTSSYSFASGGSDYQDYSTSKPPALDEGMDTDEIGITQALFECTAIYPYSTSEDRQLTFEAGESIVVFGLNDDGWYFGKKVGMDQTGWFPASHCIQI